MIVVCPRLINCNDNGVIEMKTVNLILAAVLVLAASLATAQAGSLGLSVRHIHLRVADVARTKAFYQDMLGLKVTDERPGDKVEFENGALWFGKWKGGGPVPVTPAVVIGLEAKSVMAVYEHLKQQGVMVPKPPEKEGYGWSFRIKDPDGYGIEIEGNK